LTPSVPSTPSSPVIQTGSVQSGLIGSAALNIAVDIQVYGFSKSAFGDSDHPSGKIILLEFISHCPPRGLLGFSSLDCVAINANIVLFDTMLSPFSPSLA
jgi:hypothetical protein